MSLTERQELDASELAAINPELAKIAADYAQENPDQFQADVVETVRKRKARKEGSAEIVAVEKMAEDIRAAEAMYGDGMPYDLGRIESQIRFYQDQAGTALLEMGRRLIRIKAHEEPGKFLESLERLEMAPRSAQYAMLAARKFSNTHAHAYLGNDKIRALTVLDEDDIKTLEAGGSFAGMTMDDIDRMTSRELRQNLRKEKAKVKKEKEARKKERDAFEQSMIQKDAKINDLDLKLNGQDIPTKEQAAARILDSMTGEYTYALAGVNEAIRKAMSLVVKAERINGVNVQLLSEWLGQFDGEMRTFHDLRQTWADEMDNAGPIAERDIGGFADNEE